jgi:hypothetical protein
LKTAKALVEDTKTLVTGAASDQEQLAAAAQSAVMTITRLADCVKMGAASLGSEQPEAQVQITPSSLSMCSVHHRFTFLSIFIDFYVLLKCVMFSFMKSIKLLM